MRRLVVIVAALVLAAALVDRLVAGHSPQTPIAPSSATGALTHPREGAMYHQPYTSTR